MDCDKIIQGPNGPSIVRAGQEELGGILGCEQVIIGDPENGNLPLLVNAADRSPVIEQPAGEIRQMDSGPRYIPRETENTDDSGSTGSKRRSKSQAPGGVRKRK